MLVACRRAHAAGGFAPLGVSTSPRSSQHAPSVVRAMYTLIISYTHATHEARVALTAGTHITRRSFFASARCLLSAAHPQIDLQRRRQINDAAADTRLRHSFPSCSHAALASLVSGARALAHATRTTHKPQRKPPHALSFANSARPFSPSRPRNQRRQWQLLICRMYGCSSRMPRIRCPSEHVSCHCAQLRAAPCRSHMSSSSSQSSSAKFSSATMPGAAMTIGGSGGAS